MKEGSIYVTPHSSIEPVVEEIIRDEDQESPFYVCNVNDLIFKHKLWTELFPRIKPYYAVKCNNHSIVLQVFASLGVGFDCASKSEIDQILSLGVEPSRIIFAHTVKLPSHIRYASEVNVTLMTFDSEGELYKIKNNSPKAQTLLRIKCDDPQSKLHFAKKFGCDPYTEAEALLKIALTENINVVGVSFYVGFGCQDGNVFYEAIKAAHYVFQVAAKLGINLHLLDIGGGLPGIYGDLLISLAENINRGLAKYFQDQSINIISEPGYFFVQTAFTLASSIVLVKENVQNMESKKSVQYDYYLTDGVYSSFSSVIYQNFEFVPRPLRILGESQFESTLWGPTCSAVDKIKDNILLPKMKNDDWVLFDNAGGYTYVLSSKFNGFGSRKVYNIINHENMLLLRKGWLDGYYNFVTTLQK